MSQVHYVSYILNLILFNFAVSKGPTLDFSALVLSERMEEDAKRITFWTVIEGANFLKVLSENHGRWKYVLGILGKGK